MNTQELVEKVIFSMKSLDVLLEKGVSHTVESATKIPICIGLVTKIGKVKIPTWKF